MALQRCPVKDTVCVNDRWGSGDSCKHGGYYTCTDRYNPGTLLNHKWENCLTIDEHSWGYRRNAGLSDMLSVDELLTELASTVACGGNMLLNVGPTAEGMIVPVFQERLLQLGQWLQINGESIYATKPWRSQNDTAADVWYTSKNSTVYGILLSWPSNNQVVLTQPIPLDHAKVTLIGYGAVTWTKNGNSMTVVLPNIPVSSLPSQNAWVLKFTGVK